MMAVTANLLFAAVNRAGRRPSAVKAKCTSRTVRSRRALVSARTYRSHLSIRYSCINANTCKECMIAIDGKVDYARTVRLEPRDMVLEPLPNKGPFA